MHSRTFVIAVIILLLAQIACRAAGQMFNPRTESMPAVTIPQNPEATALAPATAADPEQTTGPATPEVQTSTPEEISPPAAGPPIPDPGERPPQSQAAEIRPPEMRAALTRLSSLLNYQVLDRDGGFLGTAGDYVINTCETYIIYFGLEPDPSLGFAPGERPFIPFEAVTVNSGTLDAQAKVVQLALTPSQVAGAPAFPPGFELTPTDWESGVRAFWSERLRLSNLTTGCNVASGTTVYKVAYATQLLNAELKDGLQNLLGTLEEGILEPESGKLQFFVIRLHESQELVLVPLRVVNIPKEALAPGARVELVLLTENQRLINAPRLDSIESASDPSVQNQTRQYWGQ